MTSGDALALRRAIALSRRAGERGDEPYGAVLADEAGNILAEGENTQHSALDCTGHAEMNLVRDAFGRLGRETLLRCTAYASGEPCPMCAGALYWAGIKRVVFALDIAAMARLAGEGADEIMISCRDVLARGTRPVEVVGPLLAEEAAAVLSAHYAPAQGHG